MWEQQILHVPGKRSGSGLQEWVAFSQLHPSQHIFDGPGFPGSSSARQPVENAGKQYFGVDGVGFGGSGVGETGPGAGVGALGAPHEPPAFGMHC